MKYYGAVEAGGTKFVCSIASDPDNYVEEVRFPTTQPEETIGRTIEFFKEMKKKYTLQELLAQCDPSAPPPEEDKAWTSSAAVGQELL